MNIAVLSGKGGTGKTTVSTNIALSLRANYIDCDVEEPNGFIFLKPDINETKDVLVDYPIIDEDKCDLCGKCANVCKFNALAKIKDDIMLFQKLCHSCGACELVCHRDAITYKKRKTGQIKKGELDGISCAMGKLNISEPMAVPIIKELLNNLEKGTNIIDCPPGTSCNVVNALKYADGAILVTEPTEFGLHDMKMALELVKMFNIPFGIIINKDDGYENIVTKYCEKEKVNILGTIPYNKDIAINYSKGEILYHNSNYKYIFDDISKKVMEVLKWN